MTILIIDDDEDVRDSLSEELEDSKLNTVCAENGSEALKILESRSDIEWVVTDMTMPVMGGLDLIKALGDEKFQSIKIIAMTGAAMDDLTNSFLNEKNRVIPLIKPISPGIVIRYIKENS